MQFVDLDYDQWGAIIQEEFYYGFKDKEIDTKLLDIVYKEMDVIGDGDITVMELQVRVGT